MNVYLRKLLISLKRNEEIETEREKVKNLHFSSFFWKINSIAKSIQFFTRRKREREKERKREREKERKREREKERKREREKEGPC
jgi:hypothetical protein